MNKYYIINNLNKLINDINTKLERNKNLSKSLENNSQNILENAIITNNLINDTIDIYYILKNNRNKIMNDTRKLRKKLFEMEEEIYPINKTIENILLKEKSMKSRLIKMRRKTNTKSYYYNKIPLLFKNYMKNKKFFLESKNEYKNYSKNILPKLQEKLLKIQKLKKNIYNKNKKIENIEKKFNNIKNIIKNFYKVS